MSKRAPDVAVLTANRLQDGIVVFLAADGRWVESIEARRRGPLAPTRPAPCRSRAPATRRANLVVEPYLAEVAEAGGRLRAGAHARARARRRSEHPGRRAGIFPLSPRNANLASRSDSAGRGSG